MKILMNDQLLTFGFIVDELKSGHFLISQFSHKLILKLPYLIS